MAINDREKLLEVFESLNDEKQASLIDYAEFLRSKGDLVTKEVPAPESIERPKEETVVGAIKRLKLTYPMIESMSVFSAASDLMTDNMVSGRYAAEVIDDMQTLFEEEYQSMLEVNDD